jgi:hypothetical protein
LGKSLIYNIRAVRLLVVVLIGLYFCSGCFIQAQSESSVRAIISEADIKKLVKADDLKVKADNLIEEANRLNMEIFSVQADQRLDEKAIKKKAVQIENQAQQKQVEASALYEKCNEIKFIIYKQYIDAFWKSHEGRESEYLNAKLLEEQSSDHYFQAVSYRIEAKRMDDGYARIEKLTEANNLELQAIQKQLSALSAYHGFTDTAQSEQTTAEQEAINQQPNTSEITDTILPFQDIAPPDTQNQGTENTLPGDVQINQSMIDQYNQFQTTGQYNDTTLSTGKIAGLSSFDGDNLLKLWYEYIYGRNAEESLQAPGEKPDSLLDREEGITPIAGEESGNRDKEIGIVTDENAGSIIPADDNIIYRVQIAANRTELSQRALSRMYYGNKNVEMINENGWYKYSVGDFTTYKEASKFRKESGMSNAFVVAYRKGTWFEQGASTAKAFSDKAVFTPQFEGKLPAGLIFRIQVAASRVPLTTGQLKRIYPGKYPVEMISEDGWYKYQFMGVRLYSDAIQIIRDVTTSGAFIVAYENGVKADLAKAVLKNKKLEQEVRTYGRKGYIKEIEFHLQLAASRVAMPPLELSQIYTGNEPVSVIYEDGWYKYHLKAGNSPEDVEQFRKACAITNAFIVPYKRAAKIDLYQAILELK